MSEDEREFLDHVELCADHYIGILGGIWDDREKNPLPAQERFRNLISPWFVKNLINRNKQLFMLKAGLRQVCRATSLAEAKERAKDALAILDGMYMPHLKGPELDENSAHDEEGLAVVAARWPMTKAISFCGEFKSAEKGNGA